MNRYFRCFQRKKSLPVISSQKNIAFLDISGSLPESKQELEVLQMETARRMSFVNAQVNKLFQDYQYTFQRQNLSKAIQIKTLHGQKLQEMKHLSFRLRQIQQKYEELCTPPPLELPPPLHPIGRGPYMNRTPSFKKPMYRPPSPIAHHS